MKAQTNTLYKLIVILFLLLVVAMLLPTGGASAREITPTAYKYAPGERHADYTPEPTPTNLGPGPGGAPVMLC